jgi:hypothetical protein
MSIETAGQVEQLIKLQAKSEEELQALCEGLELSWEGTKAELIERLVGTGSKSQRSITVAQAIPLRTRGDQGEPLTIATQSIKNWRRMIFEAKGNIQEFGLLNTEGQPYKARLKYIRCSEPTLMKIIKERWYLPLDYHKDLINLLELHPENFILSIIQKPDSRGQSWLMLHCTPKSK